MIEIKDLCKRYNGNRVLVNASASVKDGDIFTIIGPSGSGKSTLLKCLIHLTEPDSGSVRVDGREVAGRLGELELARLRKDFGYLFQEGALFDSLSVEENVVFGLKYLTDIPGADYPRVAREKLELVGLPKAAPMRTSELSGGMRKRVALARAIAAEPKYLLYDEPTTGLDPVTAEMIMDLIKGMRDRLGVTSVMVTHDLRLAFGVSDRIAMLHGGNFDICGTPDELRRSEHKAVKEFLHGSLLPG